MGLTTARLTSARQVGEQLATGRLTGPLLGKSDPLAQGILAYYALDEGAGSAVLDSSGNNNAGAAQGTLTNFHGVGKIGLGGVFNGSDNYVLCPAIPVSIGTIACWYKLTALSGFPMVMTCETGSFGTGWELWGANNGTGTAHFITPSGTGFDFAAGLVSPGAWNHVAITIDGVTIRTYFNGNPSTTSTSHPSFGSLAVAVTIGKRFDGNFLAGSIDEVGIWSRVLTPGDISQLYNGGAGYRPQF